MGYALKGERVVGELEETIGTPYCFENGEADSYLMWCIWNEQNTRSFEDRKTVILELKKMLFQSPLYMDSSVE